MTIVDRRRAPDEDRAPWLADRPPPRRRGGGSRGRGWIIVILAVAVVALLFVARGVLFRQDGSGAEPALIRAPAGPYKVRPKEPGGMKVDGEGSSALVASEGGDPRAAIDLSAVPEAPLTRARAVSGAGEQAAPSAAPATPPAVVPPPTPAAASGGAIQLGAFSSEAKANAAWKALSQRFRFLQPLTPVILPALSDGKTIYRLRAPAGINARAMCGRLTVAGETCLVLP